MSTSTLRVAIINFAVLTLITLLGSVSTVAAQDDAQVRIASPALNDVLSGVISITGTAVDPDFNFYHLEYAIDPATSNSLWVSIQAPVAQQVRDGILGAWDTTLVADGRYVLRLGIELSDGTFNEDQVRVTVANATPTLPPLNTATPEPGTPTPGPSPTSLIQQPPTRTPLPTVTPGGPTATPQTMALASSPFDTDALRGAACRGSVLTSLVFMLIGIYGVTRSAIRGQLQHDLRAFRSEFINPFLDETARRKNRRK